MADNGDGTYTMDYTVPSDGTFTVSVEVLEPGLKAEYFSNNAWIGTPEITQIDSTIYFDWGGSFPTTPVVD